MANNIWDNSDLDNDGNNLNNWSLNQVPTGTDVAYFDVTAVANCTFSASLTCAGINVTSAYSGIVDFNDQTISTTGDQTYDGSGEVKFGTGTITCTGNFDNADQTTFTPEASTLKMNGVSKTITSASGKDVNNLTIDGASTVITLSTNIGCAVFTGTNGTFDLNEKTLAASGNMVLAAAFNFVTAADVMNGCTITVGGNFTADGQAMSATASWTLTVTGTAVASGTGSVAYSNASAGTDITASSGPWTDNGNNVKWDFWPAGRGMDKSPSMSMSCIHRVTDLYV